MNKKMKLGSINQLLLNAFLCLVNYETKRMIKGVSFQRNCGAALVGE